MDAAQIPDESLLQIGDVAELCGLSLRTIRYYEEAGLVAPSTRTGGGFRLYSAADVERLILIRNMKPLGFTLEQTRHLLGVIDELRESADKAPKATLIEDLQHFTDSVAQRCEQLKEELAAAEGFAQTLRQFTTDQLEENGNR